jgi:hypothetical protein
MPAGVEAEAWDNVIVEEIDLFCPGKFREDQITGPPGSNRAAGCVPL